MHFFPDYEEKVRSFLCRHTVTYTLGAGIAVIAFLRGVWYVADGFSHLVSFTDVTDFLMKGVLVTAISLLVAVISGIFVKCFIVDVVFLTGVKKEAIRTQKSEAELIEESELEAKIQSELAKIEKP